ncbi:Uncharacterised protein [Achromobacter sp. 2789STDY5608615]|nr:Uncharacterised protein [Achromobacter sp. 2789STDY5608615]
MRAATSRSGRRGARPAGEPGCSVVAARGPMAAARAGVVVAQQRGQRHVDEIGIAVPGGAVGEGQLGGLGDAVHELRRGRVQPVHLQVAQQRQLLQVNRALRPDAALGNRVAAVLQRDRIVVAGAPVGQVGLAQQAAIALAGGVAHRFMGVVGVDLVGDEAAVPDGQRGVDAAGAVGRRRVGFVQDAGVGGGDGRRAQQRAGRGHLAVGQPDGGRAGPLVAEQGLHREDGLRDARHQRKTVAGVVDGRAQHVGQFPGAVVAQQGQPGAEGAGHGGGQQPDAGHQVHAQSAEIGRRRQRRRRPLAAQRAHAAFPLAPQQDRHFAAGAVQVRLDDLQREAAGHRGVEGVAAALQHAHGDLRGQPVGGRGDAEGAADFRAGGEVGHGRSGGVGIRRSIGS